MCILPYSLPSMELHHRHKETALSPCPTSRHSSSSPISRIHSWPKSAFRHLWCRSGLFTDSSHIYHMCTWSVSRPWRIWDHNSFDALENVSEDRDGSGYQNNTMRGLKTSLRSSSRPSSHYQAVYFHRAIRSMFWKRHGADTFTAYTSCRRTTNKDPESL